MSQDQESCQTAKELLQRVSAELTWFAAKNLPDLQKELQDFVTAQDALVADYGSKFPDLRKKWCSRQVDVERLCAHVKCEFSAEKWREVIERCICKPMHDLCCLNQRIAKRQYCCAGPHERARNQAQAALDKATKHLGWMKALATSLDSQLAANLDLVNQINAVPANERATVLYLFFKLRRSHIHMAPYDASAECKEVCTEFDCDKMCREVLERPCPDDDCGCTPKGDWPHQSCHHCCKLDAPWLMAPDSYRHALDCAYDHYHKAKDDLAKAESELKKHPDDLTSLIAARDALNDPKNPNNLENNITKCLKCEKPPSEDCCRENDHKKGGR
jgi:hypothetical protein